MDAAEAPVGCDLDEIRPFKRVGHDVIHVLVEVQVVLAVGSTSSMAAEREVEERLVEIKVVMKVTEAMWTVGIGVRLPVTIVICSLLFVG